MTHIRLGELLMRSGHLDQATLERALSEQQQWGGRLGRLLVEMKAVPEDVLYRALAKQLGLPRAEFPKGAVPQSILHALDAPFAAAQGICPERYDGDRGVLRVAVVDQNNRFALDEVASRTRLRVEVCLASPSELSGAQRQMYQSQAASHRGEFFETKDFSTTQTALSPDDEGKRPEAARMIDADELGEADVELTLDRPKK